MKVLFPLTAGLLVASGFAHSQMSPNMKMPAPTHAPTTNPAASAALTDAVVQKVDKASGMVTLKHGEVTNLAMPAMTMGFGVSDKKMLDDVKPGDKVRFRLEMVNGKPTVVRLELAR